MLPSVATLFLVLACLATSWGCVQTGMFCVVATHSNGNVRVSFLRPHSVNNRNNERE
jgi:hypothetical protein